MEQLYTTYIWRCTYNQSVARTQSSVEKEPPYEQLAWLLPVFGLWHLKLNYLRLLWDEHWGGPENPDDSSSLWTAHHY